LVLQTLKLAAPWMMLYFSFKSEGLRLKGRSTTTQAPF